MDKAQKDMGQQSSPSNADSEPLAVNFVVGGPVPELKKKAAEKDDMVQSPGVKLHPIFQKVLLDATINRASEVLFVLGAEGFRFRERIRGTLIQADRHLVFSKSDVVSLFEWARKRGSSQSKDSVSWTEWNFSFSVKNDVYQATLVVSTLTSFSYLSLRLSPRKETIFSPSSWGMDPSQARLFSGFLAKSQGLLLFCGSDYHDIVDVFVSTVNMFASPNKHVMAVEEGPRPWASGVDALTAGNSPAQFQELLRLSFRHNPDVLAVTPLQSYALFDLCFREAMKGRFILGHSYASDTADLMTQMLAQGIELYLLGSALIGIVAKKTLRLNCQQCQTKDPNSRALAKDLGIPLSMQPAWFYFGKGCSACHESGFDGEVDIFELCPMTEELHLQLQPDLRVEGLRSVLKSKGLLTFRQIALHKAINGQISLAEVIRVSSR